jgi:hypothetical protein
MNPFPWKHFDSFDEWLLEYYKLRGIVVSQEIRSLMHDAFIQGFEQGRTKAIQGRVIRFLNSCETLEKQNERDV